MVYRPKMIPVVSPRYAIRNGDEVYAALASSERLVRLMRAARGAKPSIHSPVSTTATTTAPVGLEPSANNLHRQQATTKVPRSGRAPLRTISVGNPGAVWRKRVTPGVHERRPETILPVSIVGQ